MPGLIENQLNKDAVSGYDPERVQIDDSTDTVEGRIQGIIDKNSPAMKSARTRGLQSMQQRGLVNSSMAVGASERAAYDYAAPIAAQDAQTYYDSKKTNAAAGNTALQEGSANMHDRQMVNANTEGQSRLQTEAGDIESGHIGERGLVESRLIGERGDVETGLTNLRGDITSRQIGEQGTIESRQIGERGDIESRQIGERADETSRLQDEAGAIESRQIGQRGQVESVLQRERGQIEQLLISDRGAVEEHLMILRGEIDAGLKEMDTALSLQLADIETENARILQSSQSSAALYAQTTQSIGDILANPEIKNDLKQGLINRHLDLLGQGLSVIRGLNEVDVGEYLNFGPTDGRRDQGSTNAIGTGGSALNTGKPLGLNIQRILDSIQGG